MADRTVRVILEGEPDDLIRAFAEGVAAAKGFERGVDGSSKKVKDDFAGMGKSATDFERIVTANLRDGQTAFSALKTRSTELRGEIAKLRTSFAATGDKSVFGDLKKAERDLKGIESVLGDMGQAAGKGGKNAAQEFMSNFGNISKILATPEGLAVAAALAPVIGAGVAASVSAGVGVGLIAGAALIQKNNPAIVTAFGNLKTAAVGVFKNATEPMVEPFVKALDYANQLVQEEGPQLHKIFSDLAPAVDPLVHDFGILATDILPGVDKAVQAFTDATKNPAVTNSIDHVGSAFNALFTEIGDNPQLIADTFETVNDVLVVAATSMQGLVSLAVQLDDLVRASPGSGTKFDQFTSADVERSLHDKNIQRQAGGDPQKALELAHAADVAADKQKKLAESTAKAADAAATAGPDFQKLSQQINATAVTSDTLAGQMSDKLLGALMSGDQATLHWHESLTGLQDAFDHAGKHAINAKGEFDLSRSSGQQLEEAVLGAVQANIQAYDTNINLGMSAKDAAKAYDGQFKSLEHVHGLTKTQQGAVDKLIGKYKDVPDKVNTTIAMEGLTDAIDNLNSTLLLLSHIDGFHANASVTTTYYTKGDPHTGPLARNRSRWGGVYTHAAEGVLSAAKVESAVVGPARYAYAEPATGGEAFVPRHGDTERSISILQRAASWYGQMLIPAMRGMQAQGGDGASTSSTYVTNVYPQQANFTTRDLDNLQQVQEIRQRIGRPR